MSSRKESTREFRICVADVAAQLSQPEVNWIVYIEELPVTFSDRPPLTVLWQLEMAGKFSSSNIDGLIKVMKGINRLDLVQKLKDYCKQTAKKRKKRNEPSLIKTCETLHISLEARLQALMLNNLSLSDQLKQFIGDVNEAGEKRVEEVISSAKDLIDTRVHAKLYRAMSVLKHSEKSASPPSSDEETGGTLERQSSADSNGDAYTPVKGHSPKSSNRPPCPPPKPKGDTLSRHTSPRLSPALSPVYPKTMAELYPPTVTSERPQIITSEQLVIGRAGLTFARSQKTPILPPHYKKNVTEKPTAQFQTTDEDDYTCGSTGDYTGGNTDDSGFAEARKYLRRPLEEMKPLQPATEEVTEEVAYYKRLNKPTMDDVDYYKTCVRSRPSEATYEPMTREAMSLLTEDLRKETIYENQK